MAKSNFEKVESVVGWVRDKKITGYRISKETNAREMSIIALAQGRAKVKNISFETALGLIDFYDKNHQKFEHEVVVPQENQRVCSLVFFYASKPETIHKNSVLPYW